MSESDLNIGTNENDVYKSYKIIIVDDDRGVNRLIQKRLEKEGFKTGSALNGKETIKMVTGKENEVLLLDYKLPDMTGQGVIEKLAQKDRPVPFIIMTGQGDEKVAVEMMKLGAVDYITKDINFIEVLPQKLKRACIEIENGRRLKQSELALRKSEEELSMAQKIAHIGSWKFHLKAQKLTWSDELYRIHGLDPSETELDLDLAVSLIHPNDKEDAVQTFQQSLQDGLSYKIEYRIIRPDGVERIIQGIGQTENGESGEVCCIYGTGQDITEQKRAEEALHFQKNRAQQYLDTAEIMLIALDTNEKVTLVNPKGCEILGYPKEEILGENWFEKFLHVDDIQNVKKVYTQIMSGDIEQVKYYENPIIRKDGSVRLIAWHNSLLHGESGTITGVFCSGEDITERKAAEEKLKQQAAELTSVNKVSQAVSSNLSIEDTSHSALQGIVDAIHPDLAFLFLRNGRTLNLEIVLPHHKRKQLGDIPEHRVGECICGLTVQEKRPLFSKDIYNDDRCSWEECKRAGIKSFAALPLMNMGIAIGVIGLASETIRDFEKQKEFLETLAGQVSVAMVNSKLYETAQQEIAERIRAEEQIQKDLHEKVVLLREVHHRVKNNLQIMSSLLNLQSQSVSDAKLTDILNECQGRIRSMAVVHEMMYQNQDFAQISMKYYVSNILASLIRLYSFDPERIKIIERCEDVNLNLNLAIPSGLILNELISNVMKHAFPANMQGEMTIKITKKSDTVHMSVSDNGIALDSNFDIENGTTLGMIIIQDLTSQLEGELKVEQKNNMKTFHVSFAIPQQISSVAAI